jgi:hypothetical protein
MEKVKVKSVIDSGIVTKSGSPIITVNLEDGRCGSAYSKDALQWSGEMELNVKQGAMSMDGKQFYNFFQPTETAKKSFTQKDFKFEKRNASLSNAISWAGINIPNKINTAQLLDIAERFYQYLNS